jgi:hypothetical protein
VYDSWDAARLQVEGYPGAEFKRFATEHEAKAFVVGTPLCGKQAPLPPRAGAAEARPNKRQRAVGACRNVAPVAIDVYTHAVVQAHARATSASVGAAGETARAASDADAALCAAWGVHFAFDAERLRQLAIDPERLADRGGLACTESAHIDVQSARLASANDCRRAALRAATQMRSELWAIVEAVRAIDPLLQQCKARHVIDNGGGEGGGSRMAGAKGGDAKAPPLRVCIVTASTWALRTVRDYLPRWADNGYRVKDGGLPPNMDLLVVIDSFMRRFGPAWVSMAYSRPRYSAQDDHARREAPVPWRCPTAAWTEFDTSPASVATALSRPLAIARGHALLALSRLSIAPDATSTSTPAGARQDG